ncbi:MAG: 4Fe-4S binding protein [Promethearchaeota archaeon]|jgi:ferredoxin
MSEAIDERYRNAVNVINSAGGSPVPVTDNTIAILKYIVEEEHLDFIMAFKGRRSQTMEQLKESSGLSEDEINRHAEALAKKGLIMNQPSRSGLMIFRLMPFVNVGVYEYTFMKKLEWNEWEKGLAQLYKKLNEQSAGRMLANYDAIVKNFLPTMRPIDRTVPYTENFETGNEISILIDEEVEVPEEKIISSQKVEEIIQKFDDIAVGHCYCRHFRDLVDESCKQTDMRENCFTFGKSARYTTEQGFARMISKEEALDILKKSEKDGLVHKAYHPNMDFKREEDSICNCCSDCCGQAKNITSNMSNFIAQVDHDICTGCGTCVEKCYSGAKELNDEGKAETIEGRCIGCGICAAFCPEGAISLVEKPRVVRLAPPRSNYER